jgi:hypothetical protein
MMTRILPIFAIILAVALFFGYISPTYNNDIVAENAQIQSYNSALAAATAFTQKQNDLLAKENAIPQSQINRLETYMPDGVDNVQLILDLNSLASRSGVTLSDFKVADNATSTTNSSGIQSSNLIDSLDLSVSANGTYSAFQTFLAAAEQSLRPLDITQLGIKSSGTGVYDYTITFRIYWLQ